MAVERKPNNAVLRRLISLCSKSTLREEQSAGEVVGAWIWRRAVVDPTKKPEAIRYYLLMMIRMMLGLQAQGIKIPSKGVHARVLAPFRLAQR